jgi:hypothetical protein
MALVLMVGFYALALSISGALLWTPYAEVVSLGRIHPKLALGCVLGAGAVLWAILLRPDKFVAPGPQLTRTSAPALFGLIDQIARCTGQAPPADVYLLNDVNARVTQRGGVMGLGSRRHGRRAAAPGALDAVGAGSRDRARVRALRVRRRRARTLDLQDTRRHHPRHFCHA